MPQCDHIYSYSTLCACGGHYIQNADVQPNKLIVQKDYKEQWVAHACQVQN